MKRKNLRTVLVDGQPVKLFQADDDRSFPVRHDVLFMEYIDAKGKARACELSKSMTVDEYIKKRGLKKPGLVKGPAPEKEEEAK
jgi:hypothetical protein